MRTKPNQRRQHYIIFYKPFGVLSQFRSELGKPGLSTFGPFPRDVYAAGRLDADSEGLLFLTNDNRINHRLTHPSYAHPRTYLVQVEGIPTSQAIDQLRSGVRIRTWKSQSTEVVLLPSEPHLPPRPVPIRNRNNIPTSWIEITLREGRNRQVRRMTAAVGYPTLRLVRTRIGSLSIQGLKPGEHRYLTSAEVITLQRNLKNPGNIPR